MKKRLLLITQSVLDGVLAVGEFISGLFRRKECQQCKLLREWLEVEQGKHDYYEKLLLTRAGIIADGIENPVSTLSTEGFQSISRIGTLSSIRRHAASIAVEKAKKAKVPIAESRGLTAEEERFEEELNRAIAVGKSGR